MKKNLLSVIVSALVLTSLSTTAFASTSKVNTGATTVGSVMTEEQEEISNNFLEKHPDLVSIYNESKNANVQKTNSTLKVASAAAPLTSYYTYFVANSYDSSNETISGYEYVNGKYTTENDFNGTIYVGTVEIGYGSEGTNFAGTTVSKYDDILLDLDGDYIVDAFIDIWKIDNVTSGKFTSTSTSVSMNSSGIWPSLTTSINIL